MDCSNQKTSLFYRMFRPVSRSLALSAAFFSLMGLAVETAGSLLQLAPLVVLGGSPYLSVFNVKQLQALALMFLTLNAQVGYLIFRSTFLPRALGVLMAFGGLGWLTFLSPALAKVLSPYNLAPGILGEGVLTLWLLVFGVNAERWKEQASAQLH